MTLTKAIIILVLLSLGFHLLLFGFLKRRINAAKANKEIEP
jgi:membrane-bound ClpP family serine protease